MVTDTYGKVENFMESLNLPKAIAETLLKTVEDCQLFYTDFYNRNKYVTDDLFDFREYKIRDSEVTIDMFLNMCYTKGKKNAFESTFFQSFKEEDLLVVETAIAEGRVTLQSLYKSFKNNHNKNILKNVL